MTVELESLRAAKDRAIIELEPKLETYQTKGGLFVTTMNNAGTRYHEELDWEIGRVLSLGEGDFKPVEVGDRVMVRARSGGVAGADISKDVGQARGSIVVVEREEIVAKVE